MLRRDEALLGDLLFARGWALSYTAARCWKSSAVYTWVEAMLAWPSMSCTARRSPDDCSTCEANEWRSTCGCTLTAVPTRSACAFRRSCTTRGEMRAPRADRNSARRRRPAAGAPPARPQRVQRVAADRHPAHLAALAGDDHFARRPGRSSRARRQRRRRPCVRDVEPGQFGHPQPARIHQLEHGAVAQVGRFRIGVRMRGRWRPGAPRRRPTAPWAGSWARLGARTPSTGLAGQRRRGAPAS